MRKLALVLVALLCASPVMALTITCTNVGSDVSIGYSDANSADLVRGFALDITVTGGATITSGIDDDSTDYYIHPGTIAIDEDGDVTSYGSPVAPEGSPGENPSGITIEMASLYATNDPCGHTTAPGTSGSLVSFTVSKTDGYTVTVSANTLRGGIVLESGDPDVANLPKVLIVPSAKCFPDSFSTYADWVTYGEPLCWCNTANDPCATGDYQCDGDGDGLTQGGLNYRVYGNDLDILLANWKKKDSGLPGNCGTLARPE